MQETRKALNFWTEGNEVLKTYRGLTELKVIANINAVQRVGYAQELGVTIKQASDVLL